MPDIGLRYNVTNEEVELTVDGEVALSSGADVFASWVEAYNEAHPQEPVVEIREVQVPAPVDTPSADAVESTPEVEEVEETPEPEIQE